MGYKRSSSIFSHRAQPFLLCQLLVSESILTTFLRDRQLEENFPSAWPGVLHLSREGNQAISAFLPSFVLKLLRKSLLRRGWVLLIQVGGVRPLGVWMGSISPFAPNVKPRLRNEGRLSSTSVLMLFPVDLREYSIGQLATLRA